MLCKAGNHVKSKGREERLLGSFKMVLWKRMIKVKRTERMRNYEVLMRTGEERKFMRAIKKRKHHD